MKQILCVTQYVDADAYFSKKNFVNKILQFSLHLISKLRDDADLAYFSLKPKTGKKGRPAKCGEKVDVKNLDFKYLCQVENNKGIIAYSAVVYFKALGRNVLLVVEQFLIKGKITRRLLFSTDTMQAPIDVIDTSTILAISMPH